MPKTKIQAARGGFSEMRRLFESAQYRGAAELYDRMIDGGDRPANDAVLLRARLYLKADSKEIVPFLLREELRKPTQAQAARRSMYLGTGYSRLGDFGEADKHFAKAKSVLPKGRPWASLPPTSRAAISISATSNRPKRGKERASPTGACEEKYAANTSPRIFSRDANATESGRERNQSSRSDRE